MSALDRAQAGTQATLPRTEKSTTLTGTIVKIVLLGSVLSLGVYLVPLLIKFQMWLWLVIVALTVLTIFVIYTTRLFIPGKYIFPGTFFLLVLLVVPVAMTVQYSFTNFGDGTRGTKQDAITSIITDSVKQAPNSPTYNLAIGVTGDPAAGPYTFFLVDASRPDDPVQFGSAAHPLQTFDGQATVTGGRVTAVAGYTLLTPHQINGNFAKIQQTTVQAGGGSAIKVQGINTAFQGRPSLRYDKATDTITDIDTGKTYTVGTIGDSQYFVDSHGNKAFSQGWLQGVGLKNYVRLFTNANIARQFFGALAWTLAFAFGSVVLSFLVGFFLAMTLNDTRLKFRKTMRSFLLLPYAVPGFISILIWSSFYNRDFGLINHLFGLHINWLGDAMFARMAVLVTNTWLGFPYMFVVCTGALQSISSDVTEAARIDGANGWQRTVRITTPLLLISVAPLLITSFAFNFNNFSVIQLLTGGGPFAPGQFTRGSTDILISMVYRIAFGGSGGADYGFASAVSVALFLLTGVLAAVQFRMTRRLEDIA